LSRFSAGRLKSIPIPNEFNPKKQTQTAHVANQTVSVLQRAKLTFQVFANFQRILLQLFIANNVEDGQANGAGNRIAAEGIEVFHAIGERRRNFRVVMTAPSG
jgi:hypothetical protein